MCRSRILAFSLATIIASVTASELGAAERVGDLERKDHGPPRNGDLFFLNKDREWEELVSFSNLDRSKPQLMQFKFVVGFPNPPNPLRSGVIVVKSGRYTTARDEVADADEPDSKVYLRRNGRETPSCSNNKSYHYRFRQAAVDQSAFDDYHERSGSQPDFNNNNLRKIRAFHYEYERNDPSQPCKATDDPTRDSWFSGASNRSQFSYDPVVVSSGIQHQWSVAGIFTRPAYAKPFNNIAGQQVEILRYRTAPQGIRCVRFTVPNVVRSTFIRISDLEGRGIGFFGRSWEGNRD